MFIKLERSGYNRHGDQSASGLFLILLDPPRESLTPDNLRAVVRYVRLRQVGHFMMGSVQIGPERVTLSGSYGGDGLPAHVMTTAVYDSALPVPADLYHAWNSGGGHNSAGSEKTDMRRWALANLDALRRAGNPKAVAAV